MEVEVRTLTCLGMGGEVGVEVGERVCAGEGQSYREWGRDGWGVGEIVSSHSALSLWFLTQLFLPLFRRSVVVL